MSIFYISHIFKKWLNLKKIRGNNKYVDIAWKRESSLTSIFIFSANIQYCRSSSKYYWIIYPTRYIYAPKSKERIIIYIIALSKTSPYGLAWVNVIPNFIDYSLNNMVWICVKAKFLRNILTFENDDIW